MSPCGIFSAHRSADVCLHSLLRCHATEAGSTSFAKRKKTMGKGNNSQKNDKKNKKVKKGDKKPDSKAADKKR